LQTTTRLAPSPTGTLHLGNARTFLITWTLARQQDWRIVLRIEDLDVQRVRPGAAEQAIEQLRWLGIDWDEGPLVQSHDLEPYHAAMRTLASDRRVYACELTRKQIEHAASAPHSGEGELRFPPELRPRDNAAWMFDRESTNYRLVVNAGDVAIRDEFVGGRWFDPSRESGDFIVWTKTGMPAYQLAVVVDDARQGITEVVRGDDLLPSAARQHLLYRALGLPPPRWWHLPLVTAADGRRLAKRDGDTHLETCRQRGIAAERVIGLIAAWSGVVDRPEPMSADAFRQGFTLGTLPREPVPLTQEQLAWLMNP
jgi:glutamyl-tRNA synthetase